MAEVTVAVVVKDRLELMRACLDGVLGQTGVDFDVVVVDNLSTDGTWEMLTERAAAAPVPMTVLREPGTVGAVRNAATRAATAPVIAFTDSDCVPEPGWLAAGLAAMAADVAVVQGRTLPAEPETRRWAATQHLEGFTDRYEACNLFYRRDVLLAAGGFDETIGFFGEDTAAGWNVRRAGGRGVYAADAVVRHAVGYPGMLWFLRRGLGYSNWNVLVRRYPEMRSELLYARYFLRRRTAAATLAVAGVGASVATRRPVLAAAAAPYLWHRRPRRAGVAGLVDTACAVAFDASVMCGLAIGSVRERTLVL